MKTKEAIEILEIEIKLLGEEIDICNPNDDIDAQIIPVNKKFIIEYKQIIALLQQGEQYRQDYIRAVDELIVRQGKIRELNKYKDMWHDNKCYSKTKKIEQLEQKYFQKGGGEN